jgi:acyl carrier protein
MSKVVETRLIKVFKENCEDTDLVDKIGLNDSLVELGLNSVEFIKLIVIIEKEFEFEFDDDRLDYNKFSTLRDLVEYIESRI